MRLVRRKSLVEDLAKATRSAVHGEEVAAPATTLEAIEEEHRLLSEHHRHLRESIDLLEGLDRIRPDAAARLETYKTVEQEVSWRRRDLYRRIREYDSQNTRISNPNETADEGATLVTG